MPAAELKNVLLLIESSRSYGRDCLLGVASYLRSHGGWRVLNIERGLTEHLPRVLRSWSGDGVIVRIENAKIAAAIAGLNLPTVDLRGSFLPPGGATFDTDPQAVGKMAADHFLELGFRNFAYCGFSGVDFSDRRGQAYQDYLAEQDLQVHEYRTATLRASRRDVLDWELRGELATEELGNWLRSLPRPLAIFACNDVRGRQVIEACGQAGIAVPEEVAVLGVDDDEVICELSSPPLSSIRPNAQKLGFDGAAMLDDLMSGKSAPAEVVLDPADWRQSPAVVRNHGGRTIGRSPRRSSTSATMPARGSTSMMSSIRWPSAARRWNAASKRRWASRRRRRSSGCG